MKIKVVNGTIQNTKSDAILVNLFEGSVTGVAGAVDKALNGAISELLNANDLRGKLNEVIVIYSRGAIPAPRVIVVGLGKSEELSLDRIRQASATGAKKARELGCKAIASTVFGADAGQLETSLAAQAMIEGALLGLYRWRTNHTSPVEREDIESIMLVESDASKVGAVESGVSVGRAVASGVYRARDLVNQSPNIMTPSGLAQAAQDMAKEVGVKCTVHDLEWIQAQKMTAFLSVTQGSANPPKFIELEYNGSDAAPLVFVGKGLTFDSGGISLKGADGMEDMRSDMGGAAAVIGAFEAIAKMKLPVHLVGLIATCENMPSGTAYRPADVIRARNGKTIEVINTDAEGRMTLADALDYAAEFKPKAVIDLATLTGACVTALGKNVAAGYFANDDSLAQKVEEASRASDEKLWRLPLYADYRDKIKTNYADIKNSGGAGSGVGSSAVFLEEFTSYPWAHWDIAGMVLDDIGTTAYYPLTHPPHIIRGATGFGVRALVSFAREWK
ncbi:MAG: leucyl aminopeptidase [Anaerolineales bacterium]|nr:leucyl aminopeptidase [Anaerolineales bacterium]